MTPSNHIFFSNNLPQSQFIFHVDLDCFFAAVILLDHPEYRGFPLIVGPNPKKGKGRGVATTCSYEARDYGVHSGMPISRAYELCPHGIYARVDFKRVKEISRQVMVILQKYSPIFQKASVDEAYLDMSDCVQSEKEAWDIAHQIKAEVKETTGVTCSVGVAFAKTLAKIASDIHKPDGVTFLTPNNYQQQLKGLTITRIPGIGKKTKVSYFKRGIRTIGDLFAHSKGEMQQILGDRGEWAWNAVHGQDNRRVHGASENYVPKSMSKERTFREDTQDVSFIIEKLTQLNTKLHTSLERRNLFYRTVSIKIRFKGFDTYTRAKSHVSPIRNQEMAMTTILGLLVEFSTNPRPTRLIGLKFSNLTSKTKKIHGTLLQYLQPQE